MIVTWTVGPPGGEARYASAAVPATNTPTASTAKSARLRSIPRCILGRPPLQIGPRPRVRLPEGLAPGVPGVQERHRDARGAVPHEEDAHLRRGLLDRKSTRLNSSHGYISYAVFCLKKNAADVGALDAQCRQPRGQVGGEGREGVLRRALSPLRASVAADVVEEEVFFFLKGGGPPAPAPFPPRAALGP